VEGSAAAQRDASRNADALTAGDGTTHTVLSLYFTTHTWWPGPAVHSDSTEAYTHA